MNTDLRAHECAPNCSQSEQNRKTSLGVPYETRVLTQVVSDAIPYDTQAPGFALIIR